MAPAKPQPDPPSRGRISCNHLDPATIEPDLLLDTYARVRAATEWLAGHLTPEDMMLQSMPEASPVKWHLGHTTWFFETFVLSEHIPGYRFRDQRWCVLFNSYYNGVGRQHPRPQRGLLSRPALAEISAYRKHVDGRMHELVAGLEPQRLAQVAPLIVLGLNHEQQHQELILTDLKHALSFNSLAPAIVDIPAGRARASTMEWCEFGGGITETGAPPGCFSFDNEQPRHPVLLQDFQLASRPVTNGEYLEFITDGGYDESLLWLSDGWTWRQRHDISAPLYWRRHENAWTSYTLGGERPLDPAEPVCHVSFYEAAAFAAWSGARLPTEQEWERVARDHAPEGCFADTGRFHPAPATGGGMTQLYGDVWEWTSSAYAPYPGFSPAAGAVGEYNGKFMANQMVLRGGSCATPPGHVRASYRNFFYPRDRWQFSGIRLAKDI